MSIKRAGALAGALVAVLTLTGFAVPILRSDPPPWSNVQRVTNEHSSMKQIILDAKNEIRADLMFSRVFNLRVAQCAAIKAKNQNLSQAISEQINEAKRVYMQLTGDVIPVQECSEL